MKLTFRRRTKIERGAFRFLKQLFQEGIDEPDRVHSVKEEMEEDGRLIQLVVRNLRHTATAQVVQVLLKQIGLAEVTLIEEKMVITYKERIHGFKAIRRFNDRFQAFATRSLSCVNLLYSYQGRSEV